MARRCVFCGKDVLTEEHVWPDWLARFLPASGGYYSEVTWEESGKVKKRQYGRKSLGHTVRNVCYACNHDWMGGDIEAPASHILKPMIRGSRRLLPKDEQQILATWAIKTALMIECTYPQSVRSIPDSDFKLFYGLKRPMPSISMFTGRYLTLRPHPRHQVTHSSRLILPPSRKRRREPDLFKSGYGVLLVIDQFELNLVRIHTDDDVAITAGADMADGLFQIWPPGWSRNLISWPPRKSLGPPAIAAIKNIWIEPAAKADKRQRKSAGHG